MNRLLAASRGLRRPHVPVVDMCLQVTLGEVGALTPWHNTAHVEGTTLALLNALDRICAVIQGEAEKKRTNTDVCHISQWYTSLYEKSEFQDICRHSAPSKTGNYGEMDCGPAKLYNLCCTVLLLVLSISTAVKINALHICKIKHNLNG